MSNNIREKFFPEGRNADRLVSFFLKDLRNEYELISRMKARLQEGFASTDGDYCHWCESEPCLCDDGDYEDKQQSLEVELIDKLNCPYLYQILYDRSCSHHHGFGRNGELALRFEKIEEWLKRGGSKLGADYATLNFDPDSSRHDLNYWDIEYGEIREAINFCETNLDDLDAEGKIDEILRIDPEAIEKYARDLVGQFNAPLGRSQQMHSILTRCQDHLSDYVELLNRIDPDAEADDDLDKLTDIINLILNDREAWRTHGK